jgi:hypothetical protein
MGGQLAGRRATERANITTASQESRATGTLPALTAISKAIEAGSPADSAVLDVGIQHHANPLPVSSWTTFLPEGTSGVTADGVRLSIGNARLRIRGGRVDGGVGGPGWTAADAESKE